MSGPKTAKFVLTLQQKALLEEQRRKKEEQKKIKRIKEQVQNSIKSFQKKISELENKTLRIEKLNEAEASITEETQNSYRQQFQSLLQLSQQIEKEKNLNVIKDLRKKFDLDNKRFTSLLIKSDKEADRLIREINNKNNDDLSQLLSELKSMESANPKDGNGEPIIASVLKDMIADSRISYDLKQRIKNAYVFSRTETDPTTQKTFKDLTFDKLQKEYQKEVGIYDEGIEIFNDLLEDYLSLCELCDAKPESFAYSPAVIKILEDKNAEMREQYDSAIEKEYIHSTIHEVMKEMGYELIGTRRSMDLSQKTRNQLYSYDDGAAVNVLYAPNGNITMEVGLTDKVDRLPNDAEEKLLCDSMNKFCDTYSVVREELEKKGITIEGQIHMMPPLKEFAQIINIDEYDTIQENSSGKTQVRKNIKKRIENELL